MENRYEFKIGNTDETLKVRSRVGVPIYATAESAESQVCPFRNRPRIGSAVYFDSCMGGIMSMNVIEDKDGDLYAENEFWIGRLREANDDRQCWICSCLMNKVDKIK